MIRKRLCQGAGKAWRFVARHHSEMIARILLGGIIGALVIVGGCASPEKHRMREKDEVTERIMHAIAELEDAKLERRLEAIYTLERIARESEDISEPVMEVLTAYVREHPPCMGDRVQAEGVHPTLGFACRQCPGVAGARAISADNQAALTILGRRSRTFVKGETTRLDLRCSHVDTAKLAAAHLEGANFFGAHLRAAELSGAHLEEVNFSVADLRGANFTAAHLEGAFLFSTQLESANFTAAHLEGASLRGAVLRWANLTDANLEGADFRGEMDLIPSQVKVAKNWDQAFYGSEFLSELGLPSDHNERLAAKHAKQKPESKR